MKSIGIDIGGTSIKGALFNDSQIVCEISKETNGKLGKDKILESLLLVINQLFDSEIEYIGIDSAGNINPQSGQCVYASNNLVGWTGFNIKEYISNIFNVPVYVENDAVAALIAEVSQLSLNDQKKNICMLTIGTGLGCSIMENSIIDYGTNFDGGSYAHLCVNPEGMNCDCGKIGCGEKELSATGLYYYGQKEISSLISVEELFSLYRIKDSRAVKVINEYAEKMNMYIQMLIDLKHIDILIIGGGVSKSKDILKKLIKKNIKIVYAKHGNRAGIIGANLLGKLQNETGQ
jgi:glucokinase